MKNERGVELIIALLITALLTVTVMEFFFTAEVDTRMTRNSLHGLQASLMARSGIALGEAFLLKDIDPTVDSFAEEWCPQVARRGESCRLDETNSQIVLPPNMRLRVEIFDEGGKLNINMTRPQNALQCAAMKTKRDPAKPGQLNEQWTDVLGNLMQSRGISEDRIEAIRDYWIAKCTIVWPDGATAGVPSPGPSPSVSPGTQIQKIDAYNFLSLDDLTRLPGGITTAELRRLRRVLTALPTTGAIFQRSVNANTAPPELLSAWFDGDADIDSYISAREAAPQKTLPTAGGSGSSAAGTKKPPAGGLALVSKYYRIRASAIVNVDPVTGRGGVARSAEMLVGRFPAPVARPAGSPPQWRISRINWLKEGGAALFRPEVEAATDGSSEELE